MINTEKKVDIKPIPVKVARELLSQYLIKEWFLKYYEGAKEHNRAQKLIMGFYQKRPRIITGNLAKTPGTLILKCEVTNPKISANVEKSQALLMIKQLITTYVCTLSDDDIIGLTYLVIDRLQSKDDNLAKQLRLWLVSNYFNFIQSDMNDNYANYIYEYISMNKQLMQDFIIYWLGAIDNFKDYCAKNQDNMKLILKPFCFKNRTIYNKKLLLVLINKIIQLNIEKYPNYSNGNLLYVLAKLDDNANIIPLPISYLGEYRNMLFESYKPFSNGITFKFYHKIDLGNFVNEISDDYWYIMKEEVIESIHFDLNNQTDKIESIRKHFEEVFQMTGSNYIKNILEHFQLLIK